ncbi:hypothetical protein GWA97_09855 [Flavobacterium sp. LaA7.5]|nr:hypothetical protein [Flavobacterium salilacus subsp. altitudinum]
MKILPYFRKSLFSVPLALLFLIFSCSSPSTDETFNYQTDNSLKPKISSNHFIGFSLLDYKDYHSLGYMKLQNEIVLFNINIQDGVTHDGITKIDDMNAKVSNINGGNFDAYVNLKQDLNKNTTIVSTTIDDYYNNEQFTHEIEIDGLADINTFVRDGFDNIQPDYQTLGVPCVACIAISAIVTIATAAYCVIRHDTAAENCLQAYNLCVNSGASCSYSFNSSVCGGTCTILVVEELDLSYVMP